MTSIIPATVDDLDRIQALAGIIWRESYLGMITVDQIDYMLAMMYDIDVMRREMTEEGVRYYLLIDHSSNPVPPLLGARGLPVARLLEPEGTDIGFVAWGPGPDAGEAKIHKLYLRKDRQGRGLGRTMLEHAVEQARLAGYHRVILNVNKHNERAIATYRRSGFTVREAVVVDIGGGYVMDDYVMGRSTAQD